MTTRTRAEHIKGVLDEVRPWLETAEKAQDPDTLAKAGIQVRRLLREAVSVARGITGSKTEGPEVSA